MNSSSHRLEEYRKYPTDREIFISYSIRGRHDGEAVCYNGELVSDLRRHIKRVQNRQKRSGIAPDTEYGPFELSREKPRNVEK